MHEGRRRFLGACGASIALLAGCATDGSGKPRTATGTSSSTSADLDDLLPREGDGWRLDGTDDDFGWSPLGGSDGVFGFYTSPDGIDHEVVIMEMDSVAPRAKAENWACDVGWNVATTYGRFALAASTGTAQRTYTPERPPRMTRTPVPGTVEESRELLARSPELSREAVERNEVTADDC